MADEASLLQLVHERPDDAAARLVYADWLEERGQQHRAAIVRLATELAGLSLDTDSETIAEIVARARKLLALRSDAGVPWLASVSVPRLDGTCWGTRSNNSIGAILAFKPGGELVFKRAAGAWPGTWSQVCCAVDFTINNYSPHEGIFLGDHMRGDAWNRDEQTWLWGAIRLADNALDLEPFPELANAPIDSDYGKRKKRRRRRPS